MALVFHRHIALHDGTEEIGRNDAAYPTSSKEILDKVAALVDDGGRPIVLLKIYNTSPDPASTPIFHENEEIAGNVELNLSKPLSVEEVILSVRGTMKGLAGHSKVFVEVTKRLWSARQVELGVSSRSAVSERPRVQLKGYFNWPFSLKLPRHVPSEDASEGSSESDSQCFEQLPPSFSLSNSHSSISYEVNVSVRGRHNLSLSSPFQYVPAMRPPCLASLVGMGCNRAMDEDQWEVYQSFSVRGIAFATYSVDVICTFALPKPLHYTRGTSIICALAIESADENVLELLGNTRAPFVRLTRHVEDAGSGLESRIAKVWDAIKHPSTFVSSATWHVLGAGNDVSQEAQAAIRALRTSLSGSTRSKIIIGRICLAPDLTPSFSFAKMSLKYEIQILPFRATGFVAEDGGRAIFRTGIRIASAPPMPTMTRPGSAASSPSVSRASSTSRQQPNKSLVSPPQPTSTPSVILPLPRCTTRDSLNATCCPQSRDRPLPPLPTCDNATRPNQDSNSGPSCALLCAQPPEQKGSLRDGISDPDADSVESRSAVYSLRRSATTPQTGKYGPPRAPFPSRQFTR